MGHGPHASGLRRERPCGASWRVAAVAEAAGAVDKLKDLGIAKLTLLTGDRKSVAKRVAGQMHFDDYKAEVLPHEKLEMVDMLKDAGHRVAVIGDGVNDAPALAAGDVSIAMGAAGSDVAIHSASIALLNSSNFCLNSSITFVS